MAKDWERFGLRPHLSKNQRLPKSYKDVEKVLKDVKACKGNLKTVLNNSKLRGAVFKKVYALAENVLKHRHILDRIIQETELLKKETFLREELAGILIYELVYGKGLPGESRPVTIVKQYEDSIRKAYENAMADDNLHVKGLQRLPRYVRVNTLQTTVFDVLKSLRKAEYREIYYGENTSEKDYLDLVRNLETGCFLIDYHFKDLLVFASTENLTTWSFYKKNFVYIQDKSSYIPVYALDPKPGSVVIDACAAPGMKTIHIAASMENNGKIYAYEKSEDRFRILEDMLERATVQICKAECEDFYLVNANDPKFQDLECILVDPSCSGSGMVSRMDTVTDTEDSKNSLRLQKLAGFQILLLKHALTFPSVKRVVYSTCSISEQENEYVVHEVLNHFRHLFKLVGVMPDWPVRGSANFEFGELCLRAYPEETLTNGFFVAMFERLDYDEQLNAARPFSEKPPKRKRKRKENLEEESENRDFVKIGNSGSNSMECSISELQDNPQYFNSNLKTDSHHLSERKNKCTFENNFSESDPDLKDDIPVETVCTKRKKHSVETDYNGSKKKKKNKHDIKDISSCDSHSLAKKKNECTVEDDCNESSVEDKEYIQLENDSKKKHSVETGDKHSKKKKSKHGFKEVSSGDNIDLVADENNCSTKQTILESEFSAGISNTKTKKHKHKKKKSKDVEICDYPGAGTDPQESETTSNSEAKAHKKKHKKHSKHELEMIGSSIEILQDGSHHKEGDSSSTSCVRYFEHTESEEMSSKKKHRKKCKDKKVKEE